jgi:hypothetical protein
MKISGIIFTVLASISLLFAIAFFIAGSLIFAFVQFYQYIFGIGEFWLALLIFIPSIFLFSYGALYGIKEIFMGGLGHDKKNKGMNLSTKFFLSVLLYELSKLFIKTNNKKK